MKRVLLVDDNQDFGKLSSEILQSSGLSVSIAYTGESALRKIKNQPVDLLILDYKLPGISGLTVLEKARYIKSNLRVLMISSYLDTSIKTEAKKLGAYAFLDKPFNIEGLVKVVKKALNGKGGNG